MLAEGVIERTLKDHAEAGRDPKSCLYRNSLSTVYWNASEFGEWVKVVSFG